MMSELKQKFKVDAPGDRSGRLVEINVEGLGYIGKIELILHDSSPTNEIAEPLKQSIYLPFNARHQLLIALQNICNTFPYPQ